MNDSSKVGGRILSNFPAPFPIEQNAAFGGFGVGRWPGIYAHVFGSKMHERHVHAQGALEPAAASRPIEISNKSYNLLWLANFRVEDGQAAEIISQLADISAKFFVRYHCPFAFGKPYDFKNSHKNLESIAVLEGNGLFALYVPEDKRQNFPGYISRVPDLEVITMEKVIQDSDRERKQRDINQDYFSTAQAIMVEYLEKLLSD